MPVLNQTSTKWKACVSNSSPFNWYNPKWIFKNETKWNQDIMNQNWNTIWRSVPTSGPKRESHECHVRGSYITTLKLSFKKWKNNTILHLHHGMQTSKMSNKPKLSDPFPLQTSIVLWRQIKTMFLGCKSSGPHSAQIKVAEPTGMLTSLCLKQSPGRIKQREVSRKWIGCLLESQISECGTISLFPAGRLCSTRRLLLKF